MSATHDEDRQDAVPSSRPFEPHGDPLRPALGPLSSAAEAPPLPEGSADEAARLHQIEHEIARAREGLGQTMEEIGSRLTPAHLATQARDRVQEAAKEGVRTMVDSASEIAGDVTERTREMAGAVGQRARESASAAGEQIRDHPMPAVLLGVGLGWLVWTMASGFRDDAPRADTIGEWESPTGARRRSVSWAGRQGTLPLVIAGAGAWWLWRHSLQRGAGTPGGRSQMSRTRKGSQAAAEIQGGPARAMHGAREQVSQLSDRLQSGADRVLRSNPIATGLAALAVGAALGLAAPKTELEDNYLGPAGGALLDRGRDASAQLVSTVKDTLSAASSQGEASGS